MFLKYSSYPELVNSADKRTLKKLEVGFYLNGEVLYKRSNGDVLLRCFDTSKAKKQWVKSMKGNVDPI